MTFLITGTKASNLCAGYSKSWSLNLYQLWPLNIWLMLFISFFLPDQSSLQPLTGYDYHAGYRIKIYLICRLTKERDKELINIQNTRFPAIYIKNVQYIKCIWFKFDFTQEIWIRVSSLEISCWVNHSLISFSADSTLSLPWMMLRPTSTQKSPRMVPGAESYRLNPFQKRLLQIIQLIIQENPGLTCKQMKNIVCKIKTRHLILWTMKICFWRTYS